MGCACFQIRLRPTATPDSRPRPWAYGLPAVRFASAAGPLFGGLLTPVHWSLMFAINIPFRIIALALATRIPDSQRHGRPIDWPGQLLILALLWSIRLDRRS